MDMIKKKKNITVVAKELRYIGTTGAISHSSINKEPDLKVFSSHKGLSLTIKDRLMPWISGPSG